MFEMLDGEIIICRCEEITLAEIRAAIRDGARDVTGVKRRTRAGMGLCQGRVCERMIQRIISEELNIPMGQTGYITPRPPLRPVTLSALAEAETEL